MAHYAILDENNIVIEVITGLDGDETINYEEAYGNFFNKTCKKTSYNTFGNIHLLGGTPFRKNYAGIGYKYDLELDAFLPPQPFSSWTLNVETGQWDPPIPYPKDGKSYSWDNENNVWTENIIDAGYEVV